MDKSSTIVQERLERFLDPQTHLRGGAGKGANGEIDVCIMQAVDWLKGGKGTSDAPPCVSNVIRGYCIRLNDSVLFSKHRDLLKPYAVKVIGTATDEATETARGFIAANYACRVFAPIWLNALGHPDWAKECKALKPIKDKTTAEKGRDTLRKIQDHSAAADAAAAAAAAPAAAAAQAAHAAAQAQAAYVYTAYVYTAAAYAYAAAAAAQAAHAAAHAAAQAAADAAAAAAAADAAAAAPAAAAHAKVRQQHGGKLRAAALKCLDTMITAKAPKAKVRA